MATVTPLGTSFDFTQPVKEYDPDKHDQAWYLYGRDVALPSPDNGVRVPHGRIA